MRSKPEGLAGKSGRAFVAELGDPSDVARWSGRFAVHWESDDGTGWMQGPEGVSAAEAIRWGRRRARVVTVRLGDEEEEFSAGDVQPPGEHLRPWPLDGIEVMPRPTGAKRDGSEQEVAWDVHAVLRTSGLGADFAHKLRRALQHSMLLSAADVVEVQPGVLQIDCTVMDTALGSAVKSVDSALYAAVFAAAPWLERNHILDLETTGLGRAK